MHIVIGGAYSGKRKFVKARYPHVEWRSAYEGIQIEELTVKDHVVYEGFEIWIRQLMDEGKNDHEILQFFREQFQSLSSEQEVVLIMLEIGNGIVPMEQHDRRLRDLMGWVQQDAVKHATEATNIWHGLAKEMKRN